MTFLGGLAIAAIVVPLGGLGFALTLRAGNIVVDELSVALGVPRRDPAACVICSGTVAVWTAHDDAADQDTHCPLHGVLTAAETSVPPSRKFGDFTNG